MARTRRLEAVDSNPISVRYYHRVSAAKAEMDDRRMIHAGLYKEAQDEGEDTGMLKWAFKLKRMEPVQRNAKLAKFDQYRAELALDEQPDMLDHEPAA